MSRGGVSTYGVVFALPVRTEVWAEPVVCLGSVGRIDAPGLISYIIVIVLSSVSAVACMFVTPST